METSAVAILAALCLQTLVACSSVPPNEPTPRVLDVDWVAPEWKGVTIHVGQSRGLEDAAAHVRRGLTRAGFQVVDAPAAATLVVMIVGADSFNASGISGSRPFAQLGRVVVLSATSGGRHVGAVNVTQAISVSSRDGESWAEYEAREALEIAAYDRYLANKLVNRFVDALPARAALATATAAPLQAPSQQSLQ